MILPSYTFFHIGLSIFISSIITLIICLFFDNILNNLNILLLCFIPITSGIILMIVGKFVREYYE